MRRGYQGNNHNNKREDKKREEEKPQSRVRLDSDNFPRLPVEDKQKKFEVV